MGPRANRYVRATSVGAAGVAAILSPIPLADEVVLLPALVGLGASIGRERGLGLRALPWRVLTTAAVAGLASRAAVNLAVAYLPGVAAVTNAATAFALTRFYAAWADAACADPQHARPPRFEELVSALRKSVPRPRQAP
jgi:uncharacterized protein (DUF697 family)